MSARPFSRPRATASSPNQPKSPYPISSTTTSNHYPYTPFRMQQPLPLPPPPLPSSSSTALPPLLSVGASPSYNNMSDYYNRFSWMGSRDERRPEEEKDRISEVKTYQPDRSDTPTIPPVIPEKPKQPARKRKKPTTNAAYEATEFYNSAAGTYGGGRSNNLGGVRKDSLGRVMNPARAGSVTSVVVAGGRDDGSVGSGAKATEPTTIDDLSMTFDDLPDETTWRYLEAEGILPVFNGGKSAPGLGGPACEPRLLFEQEDQEVEPPQSNVSGNTFSKSSRRRERVTQAAPPADKKRRMTNTSMSAAVDTLPTLETAKGKSAESLVEEAEEDIGDKYGKNDQAMVVDGAAKQSAYEANGGGDVVMTEATPAAEDPNIDNADDSAHPTAAADDDEPIIPPESPPALRRSSRRPAPLGTSLSAIHRATRSSASPTPSTSTVDSEEVERRRFKPILADLDGVKQMLRDRANEDWLEALRNRGTHNASGSREGVSMVGARGVHTKETEAVEDFLYAVKVGDHQLKIANQLPVTEL